MYVFFDTETTGLPNFDKPLNDPSQPHIASVAFILTDADGRELHTYKAPIKPDGWTVDEGGRAYEVNKLGNDLLREYGVPMKSALSAFKFYQSLSTLKVAHNYRFDGFLMKAAAEKYSFPELDPPIEKFCTMKAITDVMKLPPTEAMVMAGFSGKPKSAKLSEAYQFCTGRPLDNAHDALADVRACKDVFFWLLKNGFYKPQPRVTAEQAAARKAANA